MTKRTVLLGNYNTADHGWTLSAWSLSDPEQKTKYEDKPSGDGSWDLSTAMTDGVPRYHNRSLSITLETSEGDRETRTNVISYMINSLDGLEQHIVLPDFPGHYLAGRVHVAVKYNDLAHSCVVITATVQPWLYSSKEKQVTLNAAQATQTVKLSNQGRRVVVPTLTVTGEILLQFGNVSTALSTGEGYVWPDLQLAPGDQSLKYSGVGSIIITYREAVLR